MKRLCIAALLVCGLSIPVVARANTLVFKTPDATLTCVQTRAHKGAQEFRCAMRSLRKPYIVRDAFAYRGPYPGAVQFADYACGQGCQIYTQGTDVNISASNVISLPTTLTQNYGFTGQISAQSSSQSPCGGTGTAIVGGPLCIGPTTGTVALVIGKLTGAWGGTTASNSGQLVFIRNDATADKQCTQTYLSGGSMTFSCTLSSNGNNITAGVANVLADGIQNSGANAWNGTCASVNASLQCVTGTLPAYNANPTGLTCYEHDLTNNAVAAQTGVTLTGGSTFTFTKAIPNGFVGSTSTAPTTADTALWWCWK